jgi:hypothetical protein
VWLQKIFPNNLNQQFVLIFFPNDLATQRTWNTSTLARTKDVVKLCDFAMMSME